MKGKPINANKKKEKKFNFSKISPYFKTLYSNQACIDCGTQKKWYFAIIAFIFSLLVAMVPLTVNASKQSGSSYVSGTTYGFKEAFIETVLDESSYVTVDGSLKNINFVDNQATFDGTSAVTTNSKFYFLGYHTSLNNNKTSLVPTRDLEIYYVKDSYDFTEVDIINTINKNMFPLNESDQSVNYSGSFEETRNVSFIAISKNYFVFGIYQANGASTTAKTTFSGDYKYIDNTNFVEYMKNETSALTSDSEIETKIFENFKGFLNLSYKNNKIKVTWIQSGLSLGVNAAITLLLGLAVFLMTRGKQNPNRVIKFYQCMYIAFWATISPAILTLIMGFLMSSMGIMLYVIIYGIRIMWLSMRNLRPQYN